MASKIDFGSVSYMLGIVSIVLAFPFIGNPFGGLVFGIIGYIQSKNGGSEKARKLNIIGITLSAIFIAVQIVMAFLLTSYCINNPGVAFCQALLP
ncbi:MAG: hypothetical protein KJ879_00180 [Nanoarchaeota archaeon]|nr:hypothetical protein [Nanoarchaeota archaeon]